jgi:hypothetical protein
VLEAAGCARSHVVVDDQPAAAIVRFAGEQAVDDRDGHHGAARGGDAARFGGAGVARLAGIPVTLVK